MASRDRKEYYKTYELEHKEQRQQYDQDNKEHRAEVNKQWKLLIKNI